MGFGKGWYNTNTSLLLTLETTRGLHFRHVGQRARCEAGPPGLTSLFGGNKQTANSRRGTIIPYNIIIHHYRERKGSPSPQRLSSGLFSFYDLEKYTWIFYLFIFYFFAIVSQLFPKNTPIIVFAFHFFFVFSNNSTLITEDPLGEYVGSICVIFLHCWLICSSLWFMFVLVGALCLLLSVGAGAILCHGANMWFNHRSDDDDVSFTWGSYQLTHLTTVISHSDWADQDKFPLFKKMILNCQQTDQIPPFAAQCRCLKAKCKAFLWWSVVKVK